MQALAAAALCGAGLSQEYGSALGSHLEHYSALRAFHLASTRPFSVSLSVSRAWFADAVLFFHDTERYRPRSSALRAFHLLVLVLLPPPPAVVPVRSCLHCHPHCSPCSSCCHLPCPPSPPLVFLPPVPAAVCLSAAGLVSRRCPVPQPSRALGPHRAAVGAYRTELLLGAAALVGLRLLLRLGGGQVRLHPALSL